MAVSMTSRSTTPPKAMPTCYIDEIPETPGPIRARVNNLQKQIDELVRKEHALNRKHKSEMSAVESTISLQRTELGQTNLALKASQTEAARYKAELERCQAEGEAMRQELNVHSVVQQHKALLVLAQEQMQIIELEQRLVQAEAARIMRDHKLALFQAKEDDLVEELAEKDAVLARVESKLDKANISLAHERAANSKTSKLSNSAGNQEELSEARAEVTRLEGKVERLEGKVRALKEGEREAREELEQWARDERGKQGSASKEKKELQTALRSARNDLTKVKDQLSDALDELEQTKEAGKEREKALKAKLKEARGKQDIEPDEEPVEKARLKPAVSSKSLKDKARKDSPTPEESDASEAETRPKKAYKQKKAIDSDSDFDKPTKSSKRAEPVKEKTKKALRDTDTDNKAQPKRKSPEPEQVKKKVTVATSDVDEPSGAAPEKKKKRKLLGVQPAFSWDPIMNSGDGVIPAYLSPVKPTGARAIGTIPRIGSQPSRLGRF